MPLSLIALLPWMCVLGNFPPFTKKIRTPSNMTAMPIKANVNNNVTTTCVLILCKYMKGL